MDSVKKLTVLLYDKLVRNTSGLELLLKKGANPNMILPEYGVTPFHIAVGIGKESYGVHATKLFLQYGGNPNIRSAEGLTPVHVAAMWGKVATLYLLLVNGGDPWLTGEDGRNAFQYAQLERQADTLDLLKSCQLQDEDDIDSVDSEMYSRTLDKVILCSRNISLEYATVPAAKPTIPETRSTSTQTSYFRASLAAQGIEEKQNASNLCDERKDNSFYNQRDVKRTSSNSVLFNKDNVESNLHKNSLTELKNVQETGSVENFNDFCVDGSSESVKENYYTNDDVLRSGSSELTYKNYHINGNLLHSGSSDVYVSDTTLEASFRKSSSEISGGKVLEKLNISEKNDSVLSFCQDKDNASLAKEETIGVQEQGVVVEIDNSLCCLLSQCMTDDLSVDIVCENRTKDECVRNEASLFSTDMFSSVFREDNSTVQDSMRKCGQDCISRTCDLMTSDEEFSYVPYSMTRSQLPLVNSLPQVPRCSLEDQNLLVPLCEEYKYTDDEEGVVLVEKVFLVQHGSTPLISEDGCSGSALHEEPGVSGPSTAALFPESLDYDSDTLRNDLKKLGQKVGPITATTKRVYLRRLYTLHKELSLPPPTGNIVREYSKELEKSLDNMEIVSSYATLEQAVAEQFSAPDRSCRWREGVLKTSFTYLLLDPRVSCNLPCHSEALSHREKWSTFLAAVFYIGKGRRSRPYAHLYEAVTAWKKPSPHLNSKLRHIVDIWRRGLGVVCLQVFQSVIPVEALTREAAMIDAIGLRNLRNSKKGEYYGVASMWTKTKQQQLGTYLLYRAMQIFLIEGERQLRPDDI